MHFSGGVKLRLIRKKNSQFFNFLHEVFFHSRDKISGLGHLETYLCM